MSFSSRIVVTYAKALFQNGKNVTSEKEEEFYKLAATITSSDQKRFFPDVFILGEELLLLRSVIVSSKKLKEYLNFKIIFY